MPRLPPAPVWMIMKQAGTSSTVSTEQFTVTRGPPAPAPTGVTTAPVAGKPYQRLVSWTAGDGSDAAGVTQFAVNCVSDPFVAQYQRFELVDYPTTSVVVGAGTNGDSAPLVAGVTYICFVGAINAASLAYIYVHVHVHVHALSSSHPVFLSSPFLFFHPRPAEATARLRRPSRRCATRRATFPAPPWRASRFNASLTGRSPSRRTWAVRSGLPRLWTFTPSRAGCQISCLVFQNFWSAASWWTPPPAAPCSATVLRARKMGRWIRASHMTARSRPPTR